MKLLVAKAFIIAISISVVVKGSNVLPQYVSSILSEASRPDAYSTVMEVVTSKFSTLTASSAIPTAQVNSVISSILSSTSYTLPTVLVSAIPTSIDYTTTIQATTTEFPNNAERPETNLALTAFVMFIISLVVFHSLLI